MFKPFALFFFILCCVWGGSILLTTDPHERLTRASLPVALTGKAAVAVMVQVEPEWAPATYNFFLKLEHGTKYMLWSMFYEEEWRQVGQPPAAAPGRNAAAASAPRGQAMRPAYPASQPAGSGT